MQGLEGVLITTDIAAKEMILVLNRENDGNIVLKELDDTHLLIRTEWVDRVQEEVARRFDQNYYVRPDDP